MDRLYAGGASASARTAPIPAGPARQLLGWIARYGVATAENLSLAFGLSDADVVAPLGNLREAGLLRMTGVLAAEPPLWVATAAGLRAAGRPDLKVCSASPRAEGHLRAVASTAVWLQRRFGSEHEVLSERELEGHLRSSRRRRRGSSARPYVHHHGGGYKRPDLLVVPGAPAGGLPVAVEVELTRKSQPWLDAICVAWKHCAGVSAVMYLAAPELLEPLARAIAAAGAQERIVVVELAGCDVPRIRRRPYYRPQSMVKAGASAKGSSAPVAELLSVVAWIGRWGLVALDTVASHLGTSEGEARDRIAQANDQGLLECGRILRTEGELCWATRAGLRAAGLSHLRPCSVNYSSAATLAHRARVSVQLQREHPHGRVIGAREFTAARSLASRRSTQSGYVAPAPPPTSALGRHRQAGLLVLNDDQGSLPIAALVEPGHMSGERIATVLAAWGAVEGLQLVVLYALRPDLRRAAGRAIAELGLSERVLVRPLPLSPHAWPE
jgi:hypothetical protein